MRILFRLIILIGASLIIVRLFFYLFQLNEPKTTTLPLQKCNLHQDPCEVLLPDQGKMLISLSPRPIPARDPFSIEIRLQGSTADQISVDFLGLLQETGFKRPVLIKKENGLFIGTADLAHCDEPTMDWQVTALLQKGQDTIAIPFHLSTHQQDTSKIKPPAMPPQGGDFRVQSADGIIDIRKWRGKYVFLYFGYTFCPDICPTSLTELGSALNLLAPEELNRIEALFISVDPKRDSPERLKTYAKHFHTKLKAGTSTHSQLQKITKMFGATYQVNPTEKGKNFYLVNHSGDTYLLSPNGSLIHTFGYGTQSDKIVEKFRELLLKEGNQK